MQRIQSGRSMVEMLGVLAIIGVLSITAVSGYTKSMTKHKINETVHVAGQLLSVIIEKNILHDANISIATGVAKTIVKAGWMPDDFTYDKTHYDYLKDSNNNIVWIYPLNNGISVNWAFSKYSKELCYAFIDLGKEWNADIKYVQTSYSQSSNASSGTKIFATFYGSNNCSAGVKCLSKVSLTDIDNACNKCEENTCRFSFVTIPAK